MHRQLGQADIHCIESHMSIGNISQSRTSRHIGTVGKGLAGNAGLFADCPENSCGYCICSILLVGVVLDYNPLVHGRTVGRICKFSVIWMNRMSIVSRYHKAGGQSHQILILAASQTAVDPAQGIL